MPPVAASTHTAESRLPSSVAFASQMRPSASTGEAQALPGIGVFHLTLWVSLHSSGRAAAVAPEPSSPRNWFQDGPRAAASRPAARSSACAASAAVGGPAGAFAPATWAVETPHSRTVPSHDPVASLLPSDENASPHTWSLWPRCRTRPPAAASSPGCSAVAGASPRSVSTAWPCVVSQITVVPSAVTAATRAASGLNEAFHTCRVGPVSTPVQRPSATVQTRTVASLEAVTTCRPSAENATQLTGPS